MSEHLLSITVAAPFVAALVLLIVPNRMRLAMRIVSLIGASISLGGAVTVARRYDAQLGGMQLGEDWPLVPRLGIHLHLAADGWSVALLLLTGLIIVTGVFASFTVRRRDKEFFVLLLVLVSGVFGVFVTQDLFVFFLFYELAVLPMYILIGVWGSSHAVAEAGPFKFVWKLFKIGSRQYAAMKLTLVLMFGSALVLVGMLALYFACGKTTFDMATLGAAAYPKSFQLWVFPLFWIGFGTLGGVFPFHTWSPDGHASAPTAVSMLHAGVLMKLGAFGVMRVGMLMLPEGACFWAPVVGCVAVINIVYGALSAMGQRDLKYVVAYSSVSHMGVVMLGAATLTAAGWNGAVFQMVAHGVMTGLLFALVGLVYERAHMRHIPSMGGFAASMPGIAAFFTLACMSSLGLPGTAGFVAEWLVLVGAWKSAHMWWAVPGIIGAFVTALYVLRVARDVFWGPKRAGPPGEVGHEHDFELVDARKTEWVALWVLGGALICFGVWPRLLLDVIDPTTSEYVRLVAGAAR